MRPVWLNGFGISLPPNGTSSIKLFMVRATALPARSVRVRSLLISILTTPTADAMLIFKQREKVQVPRDLVQSLRFYVFHKVVDIDEQMRNPQTCSASRECSAEYYPISYRRHSPASHACYVHIYLANHLRFALLGGAMPCCNHSAFSAQLKRLM